jgi:hypothetical protein
MSKIKTIPAGKFLYDSGLLFEINRRILHPLGLALMIKYDDKGGTLSDDNAKISLIDKLWDAREDPEGIIFDTDGFNNGMQKYKKFRKVYADKKILKRNKELGFVVQGEAESKIEPEEESTSVEKIILKNKELKEADEIVDKENYGRIKKYIGQKHTQPGKPSKECISTGSNTTYSPISGGTGIVLCTDCGRTLNDVNLNKE